MENLIDIHSHILPGVDDGADCPETSLRMLETAARDGISRIILTPHNKPARRNVPPRRIAERMEQLQDALNQRGTAVRLYAGSELYYREGLAEELEAGEVLTLAASRYVLAEFPPEAEYGYIWNGVYSLQTRGYRPILAHVERYRHVCGRKAGAEELAEMGCCLQVNAGSVTGRFGFSARQFTRRLLRQGLVSFVATDAHDTGRRAPVLSDCAAYVAGKLGEDAAQAIFHDNPMRVIEDEYI